jgi:hypothetical protein
MFAGAADWCAGAVGELGWRNRSPFDFAEGRLLRFGALRLRSGMTLSRWWIHSANPHLRIEMWGTHTRTRSRALLQVAGCTSMGVDYEVSLKRQASKCVIPSEA